VLKIAIEQLQLSEDFALKIIEILFCKALEGIVSSLCVLFFLVTFELCTEHPLGGGDEKTSENG
jgi:hypothetical protein